MGRVLSPTLIEVLANSVKGLPPGAQTLPKGICSGNAFLGVSETCWYCSTSCLSASKLQVAVAAVGSSCANAAQATKRETSTMTKEVTRCIAGPPETTF